MQRNRIHEHDASDNFNFNLFWPQEPNQQNTGPTVNFKARADLSSESSPWSRDSGAPGSTATAGVICCSSVNSIQSISQRRPRARDNLSTESDSSLILLLAVYCFISLTACLIHQRTTSSQHVFPTTRHGGVRRLLNCQPDFEITRRQVLSRRPVLAHWLKETTSFENTNLIFTRSRPP
jgi:hypothetical protein